MSTITIRTSSRIATKKRKLNRQKRSSKHYDEEGDVEIISSDGVLFKLPAFRLQASSVFRDMIKTGSGTSTNRIELPDPEIEKAEIVECIFDMIVNNKPFLGFRSIHFQYIIEFLQKYDFRQILEHLRTSLLLAVAEKVHPARTIIAASHLGDIKLCVRIIATAGTLRWPAHSIEDGSFGNSLRGRPLFDIRSWPLDKMESLRPSFFWALLRAPDKRTGRKDKVEEDDKAMSVEFLRLMSLEGAPQFT